MIKILAILTLFTDIAILGVFATWIVRVYSKKAANLWADIESIVKKWGIQMAFLVALTATLGSLYLSEVAHFPPCLLCWYQRILMYPMVVILASSLFKKSLETAYSVLPLSILGSILALYHYSIQISDKPSVICASVGFSQSCSENFFTYYGYITIPFMSLTAFASIAILFIFTKHLAKTLGKRV